MLKSYLFLLTAQLYQIAHADNMLFMHYHTSAQAAIRYIRDNIQVNLTVEDVTQHVGLSFKYFQQVFKKSTSKTPNDFIIEVKMNHAKDLLCRTEIPIGDIAFVCRFPSNSYFTRVFRRVFGRTPLQYRNEMGLYSRPFQLTPAPPLPKKTTPTI